MRLSGDLARRRAATLGALGVLLISTAFGPRVLAASSTDYPGPCSAEATAPGTPLYLSADLARGLRPLGFIELPDVGRFRLGISCVYTDFYVLRTGPDSALCTS